MGHLIQGVRKIGRNTSGSDSGLKEGKNLYKHRSGNMSFLSYNITFMLKKM